MTITYYNYFYNELDWELQQVKENGEALTSDRNKTLPFEQGKRVVNQVIKELVMLNPELFETEYTYKFEAATNTFKAPANLYRIIAYKSSGDWYRLPDSSDIQSTIRVKSHNEIYNSDGWSANEEITLKVVKFPEEIRSNVTAGDGIGDNDLVDFPLEHRRLLTLKIKMHAFNRKGKKMNNVEFIEMQDKLRMYQKNSGRVSTKSYLAFTGRAYGRTR